MFEGHLYDCKAKRAALEYALEIFESHTSRLLISHLEDKYKLIINGSTPCSSVSDIEAALLDIAGPSSADLIISRMHSHLRGSTNKMSNATAST